MSAINPYQPPQPELVAAELVGPGPITASGVLTADDAIAALRAMGKWRPWLLPLIAIPIFAIAALSTLNQPVLPRNWLPIIAAAIFLTAALSLGFGARTRMAKQWIARPENLHPIRWTFQSDGLMIETVHSRHYLAWPSFSSARILPDKIVLTQHGGTMFNFIPRRMFTSEADWHAVSQMLAAKLPAQ